MRFLDIFTIFEGSHVTVAALPILPKGGAVKEFPAIKIPEMDRWYLLQTQVEVELDSWVFYLFLMDRCEHGRLP